MVKIFTYGVINVRVETFDETTFDEISTEFMEATKARSFMGWYEFGTNTIYLKTSSYDESLNGPMNLERSIKRTIAHELTHFFDDNFWESSIYKEDNVVEHLAVFTSLHFDNIYNLTEQIYEWILPQILERKPEEVHNARIEQGGIIIDG